MKLTTDGLLVELSQEEFDKHVPDLVTQGFLYSLRTGALWSKSRDRVMGEWFPALRYNGWGNTDESLRKGRSFFINPSILIYLGTSPDELLKQDLIEKVINILKHKIYLQSAIRTDTATTWTKIVNSRPGEVCDIEDIKEYFRHQKESK